MQSNSLSTYNTQATSTENKVDVAKCKHAPEFTVVENTLKLGSTTNNSIDKARVSDFDFAGLAG